MNLRTVILAFLAARHPASYSLGMIHASIVKSKAVDIPPSIDEIRYELMTLSKTEKDALIKMDMHPVTEEASWSATLEGVNRWTIDGRIAIRG